MDRRALRALLHRHRPADDREAAHRDGLLGLLDAPGDPFSRHHFDPGHFTASAFVLSPDGADLLLILHGRLGLWLQPGGHCDPSDADIVGTAIREVAEETGLVELDVVGGGLFDVDVHAIPPHPGRGEPAHGHYDARVLLRSRTRRIAAGDDARDARWVPLADVRDAGTDDSVLRAVRKLV
jgi:8-oxo-dGTP pyrophosphatase MutT (NUDIX family)